MKALDFRPATFFLVLLLGLGALRAFGDASGEMLYIYNAPESGSDVRYRFHWSVLRAALERTRGKWGAYRLAPSRPMSETRQVHELEHPAGRLTVMYLSPTPALERALLPVRIPVDRNLSGYFVFLIRREDQARLDAARTVDDLRRLSVGLGEGWVDVGIMRSQGFTVVTGTSYDGLFEMLRAGRFRLFPRSAVEVLDEYEAHRTRMPELCIEEHLLLAYPLPMYFWFSRTAEGQELAARAEEGMRSMISDGSYQRFFDVSFAASIHRLSLGRRRLITITNPNLGAETPFDNPGLWFDLGAAR
jgi:hypothetical protein